MYATPAVSNTAALAPGVYTPFQAALHQAGLSGQAVVAITQDPNLAAVAAALVMAELEERRLPWQYRLLTQADISTEGPESYDPAAGDVHIRQISTDPLILDVYGAFLNDGMSPFSHGDWTPPTRIVLRLGQWSDLVQGLQFILTLRGIMSRRIS